MGSANFPRWCPEVEAFLTHLAVNLGLGAVSQNQALNALIFLSREVLDTELEEQWNGYQFPPIPRIVLIE